MTKQIFNPVYLLVRIMSNRLHKLEYDPVTQFKFHFLFTWLWFVSMIAVTFVVPHKTSSELVALAILEVSLWANFVSHMTALGSAIAGIFASHRQAEIPGLHIADGSTTNIWK